MDIVRSIGKHLVLEGFHGDVITHPDAQSLLQAAVYADIDPASIARSLLLSDEKGLLLVTLPASHCINLHELNEQLQRQCRLAEQSSHETLFLDASTEHLPPFSPFAKLECIVDSALAEQEIIYIPVGVSNKLVRIDADTFFSLQENALHGLSFSHPIPGSNENESENGMVLPEFLQQRLTTMNALPGIPETARELLKLHNRPHSRVCDLVRVIETDPLLATQIMRIAGSALYACRGTIKTLDEAITRVLGFDTAFSMALGLSTADTFKGPREGVIGQQRLFRDAVFCASLCEALAGQMPADHQPETGTAQLAGLLHNIGYALLGHLFSADYKELNRTLSAHPEMSNWYGFEQRFATTPAIIGSWLMRLWEMPAYLDTALLEQRNVNNHDVVHAQLVLLANRLLHRYGIGDADSDELPAYVLKDLVISAETALQTADQIIQHSEELDGLARQMAG
jgi:HD-like signal output (HDOD) protein/prolyl-tRNA editing enzyme YbaK/EbsC (Cys-tRNA(Pro) deacylase)